MDRGRHAWNQGGSMNLRISHCQCGYPRCHLSLYSVLRAKYTSFENDEPGDELFELSPAFTRYDNRI